MQHPTIIIDRQSERMVKKPNRLVVNLDNFEGAYNATQFLIKLGIPELGTYPGTLENFRA